MGKLLIFITGFIITFNVSVSAIEHYNKSKSEYRFNQQLNVLLLKGTNYDTAIKTLQKMLRMISNALLAWLVARSFW